jgi:arylformamidase
MALRRQAHAGCVLIVGTRLRRQNGRMSNAVPTDPPDLPDPTAAEPRVYLDYTQAELDRAYDQRVWVGNADEMIRGYADESAAARARLAHRADVHYGVGDDDTLDIFTTLKPRAPVHVHVHGGSWRYLSKNDVSFMAPPFVEAGAVFVALNFSPIPKARLPDMVAQLRRALAWVHANAAGFGGDPDNIHLSGHSSGAHLAGVLLTTDWQAMGLPADLLKSGLLMSGMYDLRPVMLSARSGYVRLSGAEILELSAILHIERVDAPILLAYGTAETPEFQRHPRAFAAALEAAGKRVGIITVPGANHFEMLREPGDPGSPLSHAALALMGLSR